MAQVLSLSGSGMPRSSSRDARPVVPRAARRLGCSSVRRRRRSTSANRSLVTCRAAWCRYSSRGELPGDLGLQKGEHELPDGAWAAQGSPRRAGPATLVGGQHRRRAACRTCPPRADDRAGAIRAVWIRCVSSAGVAAQSLSKGSMFSAAGCRPSASVAARRTKGSLSVSLKRTACRGPPPTSAARPAPEAGGREPNGLRDSLGPPPGRLRAPSRSRTHKPPTTRAGDFLSPVGVQRPSQHLELVFLRIAPAAAGHGPPVRSSPGGGRSCSGWPSSSDSSRSSTG